MKKNSFIIAFLLLCILHVGCDNQHPENNPLLQPIRVGLALQPSSGLAMIAMENDFFKKQGLKLIIKEYPSGKRALRDGLLKGEVDIAMSADVPFAVSMLLGEQFNLIATTFRADNVNRIIARKDAQIHSPGDLAGKKIGTQQASAVHYFLDLFLAEHGLSEQQVKLSFMKAELLPKALSTGRIEAFSMREPYITEAKELLGDNYVIFAEHGLYSQIDAIAVSKSLIKQSPEVIKKFLLAMIDAENYYYKNSRQALEIVAKKLGVSFDSMAKTMADVRLKVGFEQSSLLLLEDIIRWSVNQKLSHKQNFPNVLDYLYLDALIEIKPEVVTVIR